MGIALRLGTALLALGWAQAGQAQPAPPALQTQVQDIVADFSARYRAAPNAMAAGGLRPERARALCAALRTGNAAVRGWVGVVERLDSSASGHGVLKVRLTPTLALRTHSLEWGDQEDRTLIPARSPLFRIAAALQAGQRISFDGSFRPNREDCIRETSVTVDGAMRDPDFLFRFTAIRPVE